MKLVTITLHLALFDNDDTESKTIGRLISDLCVSELDQIRAYRVSTSLERVALPDPPFGNKDSVKEEKEYKKWQDKAILFLSQAQRVLGFREGS